MTLDLVGSILLTLSAAIATAVLVIGFGSDSRARIRIAAGLALWFGLVVVLAATGLLHDQPEIGVPGLGIALVLPMVILAVRTLRSPALRQRLDSIPISMLVGVNIIRAFGAVFVILYAADRLPAPFAPVAGWGDIFIGLTAIPVAWLAHRKGAAAHSTILLWNTLGLLDLIAAVGLGVASSPGPIRLIFAEPAADIMTTLPWLLIPTFLVPLLASTHLAVFYRLRTAGTFSSPRQKAITLGANE